MRDLLTTSGAAFSACGVYRYRLWRRWGSGRPLCFLMLNPSTADAIANDPTVERCERCERRARTLGYGGLEVVNLFGLRSTDPHALYRYPDPVGPNNDAAILEAAALGEVVCAWGRHGALAGRAVAVTSALLAAGVPLSVLKLNGDGRPAHPLYLPYAARPIAWSSS